MAAINKELNERYKESAKEIAEILKSKYPEIIGVSISGSVSKDMADEYSDLDIDIWLSREGYKKWTENCPLKDDFKRYGINSESPVCHTFIKDKIKYDTVLFSVEDIKNQDWRIEQKERRTNSIILIDTNKTVENLLQEKTKFELSSNFINKENDLHLNEDFHRWLISVYIDYFPKVALKRGQLEQAHHDLDIAFSSVLNYMYFKNNSFHTEHKSKWTYAEKFMSKELKNVLKEAKLVKEYSTEDIKRRINLLNKCCK